MPLQAGTIIKSTHALNDTEFDNATIFIAEYNDQGALGFVVNKVSTRKLNELEEFKYCPAFPLYNGGPVDQEHLFFIHRRPDMIEGGTVVNKGVYVGGNFKQAIYCISNNTITQKDIRIFIGYCGWNTNELEAELEEGSWLIDSVDKDIFEI